MGELGAFLRLERVGFEKRDPEERVEDYRQYFDLPDDRTLRDQGARCMDCGIPFCHEGCPLGNLIPDWNDLVYRDCWRDAIVKLHATNNFPEFTGLICPAPCESACVLDINDDAVTIEQIELAIVTRAFDEGWIQAEPPETRTDRTVAVIGSGPAGLAVAAELNKLGHRVTAYERDEVPGGLLRFGVPDAKLEKWIIDRRVKLLEDEGIEFRCDVDIGRTVSAEELSRDYDAVVVAIGSRVHRDLNVPGRELAGVHFAMDYLYQRNRAVGGRGGRADPRRPPAAATRRPAPRHPVAAAPQAHAHDVRARRGRRPPLRHAGDRAARARRPRDRRDGPPRRGHLLARPPRDPGERVRGARGPRAGRDRLRPSRARGRGGAAAARPRQAREREGARVRHEGRGRVRLRRRAHRPVARRDRDRGGAPLRPRRRPVPRRLRRGPPGQRRGDVRLRGRRSALTPPSGRDRPDRDRGRGILDRPARRALAPVR